MTTISRNCVEVANAPDTSNGSVRCGHPGRLFAGGGAGEDLRLLLGGLARELQPDAQHHGHHLRRQRARSTIGWWNSSRAPPRSRRRSPNVGTSPPDGKTFTFHLRHDVKWQSNANFKPTRDFNADDVLFSFERQWKDSNPYHKVSGGGFDYFGDMSCRSCWSRIDKCRRLHRASSRSTFPTHRSCRTWRWISPRSCRRNTPIR